MHTTVKQILQQKGNDVWVIKPAATIFEALQLMADKGNGNLLSTFYELKDQVALGILH